MAADEISTLPDLLQARCQASTAKLSFLNAAGDIVKSLSYAQLFAEAQEYAVRLISAGLRTDGSDVVITQFTDHESHIRIFWACCLAGIPICPIPLLHLDQSRQVLLFEHLQQLFNGPTLISTDDTISSVHGLVPVLKTLSISHLETVEIRPDAHSQIFPFITIKPDDIVCFMLTSGSTGNSKAVGLRHSNLLSCVRGKAKHHNTTSSSRILNWIAFDHVACISDVLLQAIVADANQYHISPTAIIQNPRSLLDLCSKYRISFTFSPNFLLAQICRDVVAAPYAQGSLDLSRITAFISGGEAVPVKTAVEFADILEQFGAPRDSLRAGFGMTETCAGCIFDTRPIPRNVKDFTFKYLSLGKCSDGVSVRVVNPTTSTVCAPLEAGQLQVKGPTVFREYYNNLKANAESFVDGWFITGDTALLDADGHLHMVGRDKDCININGVKHPSIDVEHYIEDQKIDGLMKSFVYVCPMRLADADTETYTVFYQHEILVEDPLAVSDIKRIVATNQAIKAACAVFCAQAPYTTIPLPRKFFTKTALGKISRSTLVTAYLKGQYEGIAESLVLEEDAADNGTDAPNAVEEVLFDVVTTLFSHKNGPIKRSHNLFDLGASSMQLMQLKQRLQERLSISNIPAIEILKRPGLGDLSSYLADLLNPINTSPTSPEYNPLVCLNPAGSKPPLFFVHPGMGEVLVFVKLAGVLADDRPLYALRARGFEPGQTPFTSLVEMVECYTSAIEKVYPNGPYYLGGYSFGGTIAYEMGKELARRGKQVAWVGILDVPSESLIPAEYCWVDSLVDICDILKLMPGRSSEELKRSLEQEFPGALIPDSEPPAAGEIVQWVFDNGDQAQWKALQLTTASFVRWVSVAYGRIRVGRGYEPSGIVPGALMTMFCPAPAPYMGARSISGITSRRGGSSGSGSKWWMSMAATMRCFRRIMSVRLRRSLGRRLGGRRVRDSRRRACFSLNHSPRRLASTSIFSRRTGRLLRGTMRTRQGGSSSKICVCGSRKIWSRLMLRAFSSLATARRSLRGSVMQRRLCAPIILRV
ncbi:hypothetical protein GALMADRAFT_232431 [Galerina marginata CBS 339.88]|uniref:Carrier domain-containing protein n=1 Tax=Galerina marginata (strain CBS 339.88) TaxID=685588 RepID=A0A067SIH3_GALM3|nr:hypothetical protein GALMADRAFT_232431 [Galerina marginata CBS 339.88]